MQVTVPGPASVAVNGLPAGSICTVTEVSPLPALPSGWFWQSPTYLPASGQVTLVGTCCPEVVITDPAKFCCAGNGPVNPGNQTGGTASSTPPRQ